MHVEKIKQQIRYSHQTLNQVLTAVAGFQNGTQKCILSHTIAKAIISSSQTYADTSNLQTLVKALQCEGS